MQQPAYRLMGVVNVTPDSFSDGGAYLEPVAAVAHGLELARQGADILDVGGESTRPGAQPVALEEELRRVVPVVERLVASGCASLLEKSSQRSSFRATQHPRPSPSGAFDVSVDTSKAAVARAALAAGASFVNDVTALRGDPAMATVVAESSCECCLMHMLGEPGTMQREPRYGDVVSDVKAFLEERLSFAVSAGIAEERILLDPGIGFGKTVQHNLTLLRRLDELAALGPPVVIGTSRKSFIGKIAADTRGLTDALPFERRLPGTIATNLLALERGASVFRVHDVAAVGDALAVTARVLGSA